MVICETPCEPKLTTKPALAKDLKSLVAAMEAESRGTQEVIDQPIYRVMLPPVSLNVVHMVSYSS